MKTIQEILKNDFTEEEQFQITQKFFDDIIYWISKKDKIQAIRLIKEYFSSGLYEAKQYFDKIEKARKQI